MVKILKRASWNPQEPKTHKCGKCTSLLLFKKSDVFPDQRDGAYVVCPVCSTIIATTVVWPG